MGQKQGKTTHVGTRQHRTFLTDPAEGHNDGYPLNPTLWCNNCCEHSSRLCLTTIRHWVSMSTVWDRFCMPENQLSQQQTQLTLCSEAAATWTYMERSRHTACSTRQHTAGKYNRRKEQISTRHCRSHSAPASASDKLHNFSRWCTTMAKIASNHPTHRLLKTPAWATGRKLACCCAVPCCEVPCCCEPRLHYLTLCCALYCTVLQQDCASSCFM